MVAPLSLSYPTLAVASNVDGHELWSKQASMVMVDVDGFLRKHQLPTWDLREAKAIIDKFGVQRFGPAVELYVASPGYKALAKSTTGDFIQDTYNAVTLEAAKAHAVSLCEQRHPGHTCKIVDPP